MIYAMIGVRTSLAAGLNNSPTKMHGRRAPPRIIVSPVCVCVCYLVNKSQAGELTCRTCRVKQSSTTVSSAETQRAGVYRALRIWKKRRRARVLDNPARIQISCVVEQAAISHPENP